MSIFSTHPALRWAVPGVAVAAVVGGAGASGVIAAQADTPLAPRTAAQLLVDIQNARLDGLSGTVVQRADLGVPALPGTAHRRAGCVLKMLMGSSCVTRTESALRTSAGVRRR